MSWFRRETPEDKAKRLAEEAARLEEERQESVRSEKAICVCGDPHFKHHGQGYMRDDECRVKGCGCIEFIEDKP